MNVRNNETEGRRSVDIENLDTQDLPYGRILDDDLYFSKYTWYNRLRGDSITPVVYDYGAQGVKTLGVYSCVGSHPLKVTPLE